MQSSASGRALYVMFLLLHRAVLSQSVVNAGAVPLLLLCLQEPVLSLKRIAASTISEISKHTQELAQTVVDYGAIAHLAQMILNPDAKLKVGRTHTRQLLWKILNNQNKVCQ